MEEKQRQINPKLSIPMKIKFSEEEIIATLSSKETATVPNMEFSYQMVFKIPNQPTALLCSLPQRIKLIADYHQIESELKKEELY